MKIFLLFELEMIFNETVFAFILIGLSIYQSPFFSLSTYNECLTLRQETQQINFSLFFTHSIFQTNSNLAENFCFFYQNFWVLGLPRRDIKNNFSPKPNNFIKLTQRIEITEQNFLNISNVVKCWSKRDKNKEWF